MPTKDSKIIKIPKELEKKLFPLYGVVLMYELLKDKIFLLLVALFCVPVIVYHTAMHSRTFNPAVFNNIVLATLFFLSLSDMTLTHCFGRRVAVLSI